MPRPKSNIVKKKYVIPIKRNTNISNLIEKTWLFSTIKIQKFKPSIFFALCHRLYKIQLVLSNIKNLFFDYVNYDSYATIINMNKIFQYKLASLKLMCLQTIFLKAINQIFKNDDNSKSLHNVILSMFLFENTLGIQLWKESKNTKILPILIEP